MCVASRSSLTQFATAFNTLAKLPAGGRADRRHGNGGRHWDAPISHSKSRPPSQIVTETTFLIRQACSRRRCDYAFRLCPNIRPKGSTRFVPFRLANEPVLIRNFLCTSCSKNSELSYGDAPVDPTNTCAPRFKKVLNATLFASSTGGRNCGARHSGSKSDL